MRKSFTLKQRAQSNQKSCNITRHTEAGWSILKVLKTSKIRNDGRFSLLEVKNRLKSVYCLRKHCTRVLHPSHHLIKNTRRLNICTTVITHEVLCTSLHAWRQSDVRETAMRQEKRGYQWVSMTTGSKMPGVTLGKEQKKVSFYERWSRSRERYDEWDDTCWPDASRWGLWSRLCW